MLFITPAQLIMFHVTNGIYAVAAYLTKDEHITVHG